MPEMATHISKKRSSSPRESKTSSSRQTPCSLYSLCRFLFQIPVALLLLILVFLWSSSYMIISGNHVHVCVSSRKLNNAYCLSAGAQPNFQLPISTIPNNATEINQNEEEPMVEKVGEVSVPVMDIIHNRSISNNEEEPMVEKVGEVSVPVMDIIDNRSISNNGEVEDSNEDEVVHAIKIVEEQIKEHRSWVSKSSGKVCDGRGIFIYDLPPKFNKGLLNGCNDMVPWKSFCNHFTNDAMGEPIAMLGNGWYHTHQYSLEPIFHSRVLKHPCRVYNESEAKLFYVPYYGGLDILRWHFKNVSEDVKDSLGLEVMKWLSTQSPWIRNSGKDHVFVLGKISWDFRRNSKYGWGTSFLEFDQMQNPLKLLIERQPWHINDIGIPHPTYFHPHADEDIIQWQLKIISSKRDNLVSFAGAERPGAPENIRSVLVKQCTSSNDTNCRFHNCKSGGCDKPEVVIELFMNSEFCLQPPGDSPTRKSVFDSLVSGCIPVLFDPFTAYYQYPWHLPEDHGLYSVFIDKEDVRGMKVNVVEKLMKVSKKERDDMRRYIVYQLLPKLVYGDSDSQLDRFEDAFSISINNLLDRVSSLEANA